MSKKPGYAYLCFLIIIVRRCQVLLCIGKGYMLSIKWCYIIKNERMIKVCAVLQIYINIKSEYINSEYH